MRLVKLDAIDSTNDFLKNLTRSETVENFTVISAENQTKGRGQMGSEWKTEIGKNLIMSMLVKDLLADTHAIFELNILTALSVIEVLQTQCIPNLSIKWPNDIMSGNKKIGGILIENSFKPDTIESIIGLGLNVNQTNFLHLPQASSLAVVTGHTFDKDALLIEIAETIERKCQFIDADLLWRDYHNHLFKKEIPMAFENEGGHRFMGIIDGVERDGKLRILLEDDSFQTFGIKEIKMLY